MNPQIPSVAKHILSNGLTVLVYPMHMVPKVSVNLFYHVGSKNEHDGQKGVAHLLEHMMFKGTQRLSEMDIATITNKLSGYCNASTSYDYTNYQFEFPTSTWHMALDLLADTMCNSTFKSDHLASEMRTVVQELKMYADDYETTLEEALITAMFPDHPYHYPIIGLKRDLMNARHETLMQFYKQHYVPNNATLVVTGDVHAADVFKAAENYFGSIPADATYTKQKFSSTNALAQQSITLYRDVEQPFSLIAYTIPGLGKKMGYITDIIAWIMGNGKGSRLYKKLVQELELVTDIQVYSADLFDADILFISYHPLDSADNERICELICKEMEALSHAAPSDHELERAIKQVDVNHRALFEDSAELAQELGALYLASGDEQALFTYGLEEKHNLKGAIKQYAATYLTPIRAHSGYVVPLQESEQEHWTAIQEESDKHDEKILAQHVRTTPLEPITYANIITAQPNNAWQFPRPHKRLLDNGATVVWHTTTHTPLVTVLIELPVKAYEDPINLLGISYFVSSMLLEGTVRLNAQELADAFESRGISVESRPGALSMVCLQEDLEYALNLLVELITQPAFNEQAIERVRAQLLAEVAEYWDEPSEFVDQLAREHIYKDHPYSKQLLGTAATIKAVTRENLIAWHAHTISPERAIIALVGDVDNARITQLCATTLASWRGAHVKPYEFPPIVPVTATTIVHPIKRDQVVLSFAGLSVDRYAPDYDALLILDQWLTGGTHGSMSAHLMTLRERTGLFYSIGGSLVAGAGKQSGMITIATIVSRDSLAQAHQLIEDTLITSAEHITHEDVAQARHMLIHSLIDSFETNKGIAQTLLFLTYYELPDDYCDRRAAMLQAVTFESVVDVARRYLIRERLVTIKIGRLKK